MKKNFVLLLTTLVAAAACAGCGESKKEELYGKTLIYSNVKDSTAEVQYAIQDKEVNWDYSGTEFAESPTGGQIRDEYYLCECCPEGTRIFCPELEDDMLKHLLTHAHDHLCPICGVDYDKGEGAEWIMLQDHFAECHTSGSNTYYHEHSIGYYRIVDGEKFDKDKSAVDNVRDTADALYKQWAPTIKIDSFENASATLQINGFTTQLAFDKNDSQNNGGALHFCIVKDGKYMYFDEFQRDGVSVVDLVEIPAGESMSAHSSVDIVAQYDGNNISKVNLYCHSKIALAVENFFQFMDGSEFKSFNSYPQMVIQK